MTAPNPWPPTSFIPADPELRTVRRICWALVFSPLLLAALVPAVLRLFFNVPAWVIALPVLLVLAAGALSWRIMHRQVAALGYREAERDLSVCRGVMWRKLVVIPYGRMQYVELTSGPLERRYGLCRLTLNTAESGATAHVLGLPAATGEALRERLVAAGEEQAL